MAAPLTTIFWCIPATFVYFFWVFWVVSGHATAFIFKPQDILDVVSSSCLVALPKSVNDNEALHLLSALSATSYNNESRVVLGKVDTSTFLWPNGKALAVAETSHTHSSDFNDPPVLLLFKRMIKDRKCLYIPKHNLALPTVRSYHLKSGVDYEIDNVINFINLNCETFRTKEGKLSYQGIHRDEILGNIYSSSRAKYSVPNNAGFANDLIRNSCSCESQGKTYMTKYSSKVKQFCTKKLPIAFDANFEPKLFERQHCERISLPSTEDFLNDYVFKSKPVIIEGATQHWPALKKWTNDYLREMYGQQVVHIKATPSGEFEGVEQASRWENKFKIKIPKEVLAKLPYPDLVVVRPATLEIPFSEFLDIVEDVATNTITNMSAYLEYSSIRDYFPELRQDFDEMSFFKDILTLRHINMWLSDGNTVGKLHFDPFDNFMCQISGEKEFILYDPHQSQRLYEAHIQEAMLSYDKTKGTFARQHLLDSTSMVMSPVDIRKPDFQRFPKFADALPMSCKIRPGDVLYMPAFWWHEVKSSPNVTERRNLAINFWYEPFLRKEFPCAECGLDVNPRYFNML